MDRTTAEREMIVAMQAYTEFTSRMQIADTSPSKEDFAVKDRLFRKFTDALKRFEGE